MPADALRTVSRLLLVAGILLILVGIAQRVLWGNNRGWLALEDETGRADG